MFLYQELNPEQAQAQPKNQVSVLTDQLQTQSMEASARSPRWAVLFVVLALLTSCGSGDVEWTTTLHSCTEVQPADPDGVDPPQFDNAFRCGRILPDKCLSVTSPATVALDDGKAILTYLGETSELSDICSEDILVGIEIVSDVAVNIPSGTPVFFNGQLVPYVADHQP